MLPHAMLGLPLQIEKALSLIGLDALPRQRAGVADGF